MIRELNMNIFVDSNNIKYHFDISKEIEQNYFRVKCFVYEQVKTIAMLEFDPQILIEGLPSEGLEISDEAKNYIIKLFKNKAFL